MTTTTDPRPATGGPRGATIAGGALAALVALALLAVGAVALWGVAQRDDDGYLSTAREPFSTLGAALATENLDVGLDGGGWLLRHSGLDHVRIQVEPRTSKPVFAGIARTRDVSAYLAGTPYTVVRDVSYSPFHATYGDRSGALRPAPPGRQSFWAAAVHGSGAQRLEWDVREGDWSVVVMNADGSRVLAARVGIGVQAGVLTPIAWVALAAGAALLALAGVLLVRGAKRGAS